MRCSDSIIHNKTKVGCTSDNITFCLVGKTCDENQAEPGHPAVECVQHQIYTYPTFNTHFNQIHEQI